MDKSHGHKQEMAESCRPDHCFQGQCGHPSLQGQRSFPPTRPDANSTGNKMTTHGFLREEKSKPGCNYGNNEVCDLSPVTG